MSGWMRRDCTVGIDVGGTEVKAVALDFDGKIISRFRVETCRHHGTDHIVDKIGYVEAEVRKQVTIGQSHAIVGTGVAIPGLVDEIAGVSRLSVNLGWKDYPVRRLLEQRLGREVAIAQDVRSGGLAEARLGSGSEASSIVFVAIGTGIGSAVVLAGVPITGANARAGEIGHVIVRPDGPRCACGRRGCLEAVASAAAIGRRYSEVTGVARSALDIARMVNEGDRIATEIWRDAVEALADGICILGAIADPEVVVVGGGLAQAGPTLLEPLRLASIRKRDAVGGPLRIVGAAFGVEAGAVGAALSARPAGSDGGPAGSEAMQ